MIKRIIHILQFWDFIWSLPLAFVSFIAYGVLGNYIFGEGFGFYDPSMIQAFVYAAMLVVGANAITQLGIYFNARKVHDFFYKEAKTSFQNLEPKFKLCVGLTLFVFFYALYFLSLLFVWKVLV